MSTCKDCIHYDVCEALEKNGIKKVSPTQCGCYKPTDDVVPKSEYDKTILLLEEEIAELKNSIFPSYWQAVSEDEAIKIGREYGRAEAASEIFAEIYEDCFDQFGYLNYEALAELKKKYTDCDLSPAPEEKYFSPQQVREMSPRELHDNFEAIKKSMELWQI